MRRSRPGRLEPRVVRTPVRRPVDAGAGQGEPVERLGHARHSRSNRASGAARVARPRPGRPRWHGSDGSAARSPSVEPVAPLRLVTANLLHGMSLDTGQAAEDDLRLAARELRGDLIGLQEVDRAQDRSGGVDQAAVVAETVGARAWRFVPSLEGHARPHPQLAAGHLRRRGGRRGPDVRRRAGRPAGRCCPGTCCASVPRRSERRCSSPARRRRGSCTCPTSRGSPWPQSWTGRAESSRRSRRTCPSSRASTSDSSAGSSGGPRRCPAPGC